MENNIINLQFDKDVSGLAGNEYGYEQYKKQLLGKFDMNKNNIIVFPEQIQKIAISFIQGLFGEILEKIDKNDIEKYITIKTSSERLTEKVVNNIKF